MTGRVRPCSEGADLHLVGQALDLPLEGCGFGILDPQLVGQLLDVSLAVLRERVGDGDETSPPPWLYPLVYSERNFDPQGLTRKSDTRAPAEEEMGWKRRWPIMRMFASAECDWPTIRSRAITGPWPTVALFGGLQGKYKARALQGARLNKMTPVVGRAAGHLTNAPLPGPPLRGRCCIEKKTAKTWEICGRCFEISTEKSHEYDGNLKKISDQETKQEAIRKQGNGVASGVKNNKSSALESDSGIERRRHELLPAVKPIRG